MDGLLNKAKGMMNKSGSSGQSANTDPNAQKQDYGDKAFAAIGKKAGIHTSAEQNEKITDGARGLYEKQTGSKVNPKVSYCK